MMFASTQFQNVTFRSHDNWKGIKISMLRRLSGLSHIRPYRCPHRGFSSAQTAAASAESDTSVPEPKKPMTFGCILLYASGAASAVFFGYNFYQAGGNLHTTEILMGKRLAKLPFYWPPGPGQSVKNTEMPDLHSVSPNMRDQLSAWFINRDCNLKSGVCRNDILELFGEKLNLIDSEKETSTFSAVGDEEFRKRIASLTNSFIEKGSGRLMEHKRLSGVSIQDSLMFLDTVLHEHLQIDPFVSDRVEAVLNEELGLLVTQMQQSPAPVLADVEIDDAELLAMELEQLVRDISLLEKSSRQLTDAEKDRLKQLRESKKSLEKDIKNLARK
jgi:hypothetical protein